MPPPEPAPLLSGWLYVFVAFDWGDEIDLAEAARLSPGVPLDVSRRPRTPTSIAYKPPPLRFPLEPAPLDLPGLPVKAYPAEVIVFDFAAVSVAFRVPFHLSPDALRALAGSLTDQPTATGVVRAARAAVEHLHRKVLPAIQKPSWQDNLWEEYFVFQLPPEQTLRPDALLAERAGWLAGLLRLEDQPLSDAESAEATRLSLRYGPDDLFVADWAAAFLLDREPDCLETLQAIEFANLQLLEYRHIDNRLDDILAHTGPFLHRTAHSRLPWWRSYNARLRLLGDFRVEATTLFERTGNVLKLVGDQYLARVYRLLAARFHLPDWEASIQRKLDVLEDVYQVLSQQVVAARTEFLEVVVILLIAVEILLALFVKH